MSDEAQRWKDKYLANLEAQEKLEQRWSSRLDLLRRGLVRSSLAAEGSDKAIDQCMQELREIIRREEMDAGLAGLIPRLEKVALESEQRRQERTAQIAAALRSFIEQLQQLPLPREINKPLKKLSKQLRERAEQVRELPALLIELSALQAQALALFDSDEAQRPGLLQRLFGGRDKPNTDLAAPATSLPPAADQDVDDLEQVAPRSSARAMAAQPSSVAPAAIAPVVTTGLDSLPAPVSLLATDGDPAYSLPESPEPGYSAVAKHVAESLLALLNGLELPERHQPQGEDLRQRLQGGLNWYELVPVLDDLAVLVLAVTDSGQREFAVYLQQLNERLAAFLQNLSTAQEGYNESQSTARALDQELRDQVSGLQASVQDATDLAVLKRTVEQRLDGLLGTMGQFRQQREVREHEVAERLKGMVERMAEMEREANGFREHMEEQRLKALTDPLTGLPNRAGWSERLELEMARWQRYGGDLLMAVLDIDHFKRINDNYGHLAGDKVLKIIANELAKRLRKTDFIARFGGEEFVVLIPSTPLEGGQQLLETLRSAAASCPFHFKGEPVTITLSGGLTAFAANEQADQVFERADQALYRAKNAGRDRVELG